MKLHGLASQLISCEYGVGFMAPLAREIRLAHGIHVAPEPQDVRPATEAEARAYFSNRANIRREAISYYEQDGFKGD